MIRDQKLLGGLHFEASKVDQSLQSTIMNLSRLVNDSSPYQEQRSHYLAVLESELRDHVSNLLFFFIILFIVQSIFFNLLNSSNFVVRSCGILLSLFFLFLAHVAFNETDTCGFQGHSMHSEFFGSFGFQGDCNTCKFEGSLEHLEFFAPLAFKETDTCEF